MTTPGADTMDSDKSHALWNYTQIDIFELGRLSRLYAN